MARAGYKVRCECPSVSLPATSAQAIGLALHELATNATKYGALEIPGGRLEVLWREELDDGNRRVILNWTESGVVLPEAGATRRKGYGTQLIERALPYQLGAKTNLEFSADGMHCTIAVPLTSKAAEARRG